MKKLLLLAAAAGAGYLIYRQVVASRAEDDLWSEATQAPDFTEYSPPESPTPPAAAEGSAAAEGDEAEESKTEG